MKHTKNNKIEISLSSTFGARSRCHVCGSKIQLTGGTIHKMFFWTYKASTKRGRGIASSSSMMTSIATNNIFRTRRRIRSVNLRFHKNEKSSGDYFADEMSMTTCPKCLGRRHKSWAFKSSHDLKPEGINRRCKITYK